MFDWPYKNCLAFWWAALVLTVGGAAWCVAPATADEPVDFNRDVRPILSNHCWNCHGPDERTRQAGLRLDLREPALATLESGRAAVVPGQAQQSTLVARIESADENLVMPPPEFKRPLNARQKEILRRWIASGAEFAQHWAYLPARRAAPPAVHDTAWPRNEIDPFVLAPLEARGVRPSPEADRATWLRRVTLDLTGLPPSVAELDDFLADTSVTAYERVVDRLLSTPAHAERMAMHWLDAARFADTNGYNNDETRSMWPWRDWVIRAFAANMPFDQFLTEQLAGDLLPNATVSQKVATGFVRNHVLTTEGGIIEEEYHVEYVADRVHTVSTVFLAMSMQCARCHDHKYDPLTMRDYYQFAAYFNNVPDRIVGYSQGRMAEPLLKVPSPEQVAQLESLAQRQVAIEAELAARPEQVAADLAAWEAALTPDQIAALPVAALTARFDGDAAADADPAAVANSADAALPGKIVGDVQRKPGKHGQALAFAGQGYVDCGQVGSFEADQAFTLCAWVHRDSNEPTTVLSKMDDAAAHRGYDVILEEGKIACHVVHQWPDKAVKVLTQQALPVNAWRQVTVVWNGTRDAAGIAIWVDGERWPVDIKQNGRVDGSLLTDKPFHIGKRGASAPFRGLIDDVQVYSAALTDEEIAAVAAGQPLPGLKGILAVPREQRSGDQARQLRDWYLRRIDPVSQSLRTELSQLPARRKAIDDAVPVVMVMVENEPRRPSYLLNRGQYDQKGEAVPRGVPQALPSAPSGAADNRLGLAQWLTDPAHPLTARVAVNRWWEMFFGTGIVETSEDFGIQGAVPSHPELLDWLATELIARRWNVRSLLKTIVLSATYRQSSKIRPDLQELDPANRWLARGPRYRLAAETIRDAALFQAGLLSPTVGGPSVKPYQPEGLWEDVSVERREKYQPDPGDGIYRRSMYTFWKRTCPPPAMSTFDAPDRETCLVRRARTNTPLQALVLLNDPTYVEASRKLAERVLAGGKDGSERARLLLRLALSREPTAEETQILTETAERQQTRFAGNLAAAEQLLAVGRAPRDPQWNTAELAAWSTVCGMVLNLSETVTKP